MDIQLPRAGHLVPVPWSRVLVLDTETTGLDPSGDSHGPHRICSAYVRLLERDLRGEWREIVDLWRGWRFDPERDVPEQAGRVNGFWRSSGSTGQHLPGRIDLRGNPSFGSIAGDVHDAISGEDPVVCHNAPFDRAFLDAEFRMAGLPPLPNPSLCTKAAFSDMMGLGRPHEYVSGTSLDRLCDVLGISRSGRTGDAGAPHGASAGTALAAACFAKLDRLGWMDVESPLSLPHLALPGGHAP